MGKQLTADHADKRGSEEKENLPLIFADERGSKQKAPLREHCPPTHTDQKSS